MLEEMLSLAMAPDLAVVTVLLAVLIIYGVIQGTGVLLSVALALPIAGFLYQVFPYQLELASLSPWSPPVLFILLVLFTIWILQRTIGLASGSNRPIHIVITAVALTALLISFSYHVVLLPEGLYDFGNTFDAFFGSTTNFFWIVALALLTLFVV
jgi:hypothetical protein